MLKGIQAVTNKKKDKKPVYEAPRPKKKKMATPFSIFSTDHSKVCSQYLIDTTTINYY